MLNNRRSIKSKKGFTLVEMIIVLAVIAIMGMLVLPGISGYLGQSTAKQDSVNIKILNDCSFLYGQQVKAEDDIFAGIKTDNARMQALVDAEFLEAPLVATNKADQHYGWNILAQTWELTDKPLGLYTIHGDVAIGKDGSLTSAGTVEDYASLPCELSPTGKKSFTVDCTFSVAKPTSTHITVVSSRTNFENGFMLFLYFYSSKKYVIQIDIGGNGNRIDTGVAITFGQKYHVVATMTFDEASGNCTWVVSVDGTEKARVTKSDPNGSAWNKLMLGKSTVYCFYESFRSYSYPGTIYSLDIYQSDNTSSGKIASFY